MNVKVFKTNMSHLLRAMKRNSDSYPEIRHALKYWHGELLGLTELLEDKGFTVISPIAGFVYNDDSTITILDPKIIDHSCAFTNGDGKRTNYNCHVKPCKSWKETDEIL